MSSLEDVSNLLFISKEVDHLYKSVFLLSCFVFIPIECFVLYLTKKIYQYINQRHLEENNNDAKIASILISGIVMFILSFYLGLTFLGINKNYFFQNEFY